MHDNELQKIIEKLNIFENAYDLIRLVDPVKKNIINLHNNVTEDTGIRCFDYWGKNKVCDNCISIRAFRDNKTYIKMEYNEDNIYMVTAIPIELSDRRLVMELLKNATDSLILDSDRDRYSEMYAMIDNMNNIAMKDSLTGIYNRRYMSEKLPIELANAVIAEHSLSVIMTDIDFFKNVNDTYGHLAGDSVLRQFAQLLAKSLSRDTDWVARYGGEEFIICLPHAGHKRATEIAELMRKNLENYIMDCGENKLQITASFGVSTMTAESSLSMEQLIGLADNKLYEAKHNGRNRVES